MDSYIGLCRAPLPAPAAIAVHINQRRGTSSLSPSERDWGGGAWNRHFPRGLAYIFHGTLRMSCLSSADNSLGPLWWGRVKRERERIRGKSREHFNMHLHIIHSFRSFLFILSFGKRLNGLPNGGFKCSFYSLDVKLMYTIAPLGSM